MTRDRLHVLVLTPSVPSPSWGFGSRVFHLSRRLALRHSVTLLCYEHEGREADVERLRADSVDVRLVRATESAGVRRRQQAYSLLSPLPFHGHEHVTSGMQKALTDIVREGNFDLVQVESSCMAGFRFPAGPSLVVDEHNIESELLDRMRRTEISAGRRLFNSAEYRKYVRFENRLWRRSDATVVTSDRDAGTVRSRVPGVTVGVVPNSVDPDYFQPSGRTLPKVDSIVFTGLLTYRPNLDGIRWFVNEVLPQIQRSRPGATVSVVGNGREDELEALRRPGVTVTGWVPDVRPYLERAAVVVAPLRMGGGTRLKVVEALSMGRPLVSTTLGCEGIDVRDGGHLLVADHPEEFARAVCRLLRDQSLAERLSNAGRDMVRERYSWASAADLLESVYGQLLAGRPGRIPPPGSGARWLAAPAVDPSPAPDAVPAGAPCSRTLPHAHDMP